MNTSILKLAIESAENSIHKHRVAAVIFKGKRVISVAHNSVRSNSIPTKYKSHIESVHSECEAIIKAKKNLKGYSILVIRLTRKGELRMSFPCSNCFSFIQTVGLKSIFYSTNDGTIERIKL